MIAYDFSKYEVAVNVDNLFSSRAAVLITEGGTGSSPATSTDQYFFQGPMSVMVTLKAHLVPHCLFYASAPPPRQSPRDVGRKSREGLRDPA